MSPAVQDVLDRKDALTALLIARGAAELAHPGGSLLAHCRRVAGRLERWGADPVLVAAGLCHAAYGTQGYPYPLCDLEQRELLRKQLGDEAEGIVHAYCALDRDHFIAVAGGRGAELRDRFGGEYWVPSSRLQRQLAELTVANELDVIEHAELSREEAACACDLIAAAAPYVSQAAWSELRATARVGGALAKATVPASDPDIAYRDLGRDGPLVLLWHGGATPQMTWARQHGLAAQARLRIPCRRGFAPSAPAARQDWAHDARDLLRVMPNGAHVVAHSYGGVSALCAAAIAPVRFGSLTLIEPPLWHFAAHDPEVQQAAELTRAFANGKPDARDAFLAMAQLTPGHPDTERIERLARGFRDPGEAAPDVAALRAAGVPTVVVSGGYGRVIEQVCDAVARALGSVRWTLCGAGHAVQRHADFNAKMTELLDARRIQ